MWLSDELDSRLKASGLGVAEAVRLGLDAHERGDTRAAEVAPAVQRSAAEPVPFRPYSKEQQTRRRPR